ncbi:TPA: DNA mismatch repair protein MutS [Methanosarcina acetivorans]|uniref:DNA mismatch repair protein MutS n=2 Tax=Methanosarcina acetivorans TaxID=2214 RepID=MUTS_METAC|nr:DNA mismatch repair protein MutS [Methanosarcina acetivorans]Q8TTB4.1 RecName: Full=DNA mismatch repair protein MutS [Methanosarcina acetivorans C2A]AAM03967.1 DNA mismatch repair protein [Methanosarcina acetivorans C2A]HIH95717.1 DNA mismatch repair protein MutS [Methanosarcina acetivorans]
MTEIMTPAMRQYYEAKQAYPDTLIFFRMGDFYESFGEDAKTIAKELEITLTARGKDRTGERMPLAGIPYHAIDTYLPRLINKGYKVAICEQLEDPKKAKGVVKRGVVRVVTPGTAIDSSMFSDASNNYLMAVAGREGGKSGKNGEKEMEFGISFLDISTGEFLTTQFTDSENFDKLLSELARMHPAECILPPSLYGNSELTGKLREHTIVQEFAPEVFGTEEAGEKLKTHFGVATLEGMGCQKLEFAVYSAWAALEYAKTTQMRDLTHINTLRTYSNTEFMILDSITLRNLEIVKNVRDEGDENSLYRTLNCTRTPMGNRTLKKWLLKPLLSVEKINPRLDAIEELAEDSLLRYDIRDWLSDVRDIERLVGRIVYGNASARDLVALKKSLGVVPSLRDSLLEKARFEMLKEIAEGLASFSELEELAEMIEIAIMDEPPVSVREGGMIKSGYSPELDELRDISSNSKQWIAAFQQKERERSGIKSLKVGYNKVFGYYIEVTHANSSQVPEDYIRKQTMANAERFFTPELKEKESLILTANEKAVALEYEIFAEITRTLSARSRELQETAERIGTLDVLASLAEATENNNYTRPQLTEDCKILIRDGRHPVVESTVSGGFVPNDTEMDCKENQFLLVTGPNMAGKSTYMRQTALIAIMAQVGSFVPASYASVGIIDQVFTRIGAFDDLASGQSTFMVEMVELANILNNASPKSLVLLDEIGRGTSTYDGYSIAKAVVEFLHNRGKVGIRALFATHYHQLTALEEKLKRVKNYHIAVKEDGHELVFLRKIVPGATDRSYGIHVARLAGVPEKVIERANEILKELERENVLEEAEDGENGKKKKSKATARYTQMLLFDPGSGSRSSEKAKGLSPVEAALKKVNPDEMTPIEALNKLHELKKLLG